MNADEPETKVQRARPRLRAGTVHVDLDETPVDRTARVALNAGRYKHERDQARAERDVALIERNRTRIENARPRGLCERAGIKPHEYDLASPYGHLFPEDVWRNLRDPRQRCRACRHCEKAGIDTEEGR